MDEPVGILYVYGNPVNRELVREALEKEGGDFRLIEAGSRDEFETMIAEEDIGLILTDARSPASRTCRWWTLSGLNIQACPL